MFSVTVNENIDQLHLHRPQAAHSPGPNICIGCTVQHALTDLHLLHVAVQLLLGRIITNLCQTTQGTQRKGKARDLEKHKER